MISSVQVQVSRMMLFFPSMCFVSAKLWSLQCKGVAHSLSPPCNSRCQGLSIHFIVSALIRLRAIAVTHH